MLDPSCDLKLWPHPWPWPRIFLGHSAWQIDQFPTCWPMNGLFVHWSRGWGVSSFSERLVKGCQDWPPSIKHHLWGAINFTIHTKYVKYECFWHPGFIHGIWIKWKPLLCLKFHLMLQNFVSCVGTHRKGSFSRLINDSWIKLAFQLIKLSKN